jgi:hypothetical protein
MAEEQYHKSEVYLSQIAKDPANRWDHTRAIGVQK